MTFFDISNCSSFLSNYSPIPTGAMDRQPMRRFIVGAISRIARIFFWFPDTLVPSASPREVLADAGQGLAARPCVPAALVFSMTKRCYDPPRIAGMWERSVMVAARDGGRVARPGARRQLLAACSAPLLDGRLIRSSISAGDPSCRLIRPLIAAVIRRVKRAAGKSRSMLP